MRPFVEGHGYWLCVPKPWNGRRFLNSEERFDSQSKCQRIENVVRRLALTAKRRNDHQHHSHYREGQSLFVLPKALSAGVRQWNHYENRFKKWLEERNLRKSSTISSDDDRLPVVHRSSSTNNESRLRQNSSFEQDPLRAFYTIWHSNTSRVSENKLSTTEKVFEYIDSIWTSDKVDRSLQKTPKGGVSGRIDDPSSLSTKARTTLQRWSRIVSHYDVGNESGEDEDPVDMWNRSIETSVACHSPNALSSALSTPLWNSSSRKRVHCASKVSNGHEVVESPIAASTAIRPIVEPSHVEISCGDIECVFKESPLVRSVPNVELSDKASLNIENDENSPTPAISSKDSSKATISESHTRVGSKKVKDTDRDKTRGSQRRSNRIQLMKCLQNTVTVETEHATPLRPQASRAATSSADVSKTDTFTIENETPKSKSRLVQKSTNNEDSRCESGTATRPSSRKRKGKSFGLVESEVVNGAVTSLLTPVNTSMSKKSKISNKVVSENITIRSSSSRRSSAMKTTPSMKRTPAIKAVSPKERKSPTMLSTPKRAPRRTSTCRTKT